MVLHDDVVRRLDAHGVEHAERPLGSAGAARPCEIDALGVADARDIQVQTRKQPRHQHGIEQVAVLFLVDGKRQHADVVGEVDKLVEVALVGLVLCHDLGHVVLPDGVGKVQRQVLLGTAGVLGKGARQQRGRVGDDDGLLRQNRGELLVEVDLCLGILGHGLDDQVGVGHCLGKIELQLECGVGALDGGERRLLVEGLGAIGDTGAPLARAVRHALNCRDVLLAHVVDLGLGAADAALAAQPDRHIKAAVGGLEGNLASQHAAAGNANGLVAHGTVLSCVIP